MNKFAAIPALLALSSVLAGTVHANAFYTTALDETLAAQDVIDERLSMAGPLFNGWDRTDPNGGNAWVTGAAIFNKDRHFNGSSGFKSSLGGGYFGYDHAFGDFRLGLAVNAGGGSLKSYHGGPSFDFDNKWWGTNIYGTWTGKKVNVIANVGYLHSYNDSNDSYYGKDDVEALTFGLRFETSFVVGPLSFVPYYGLRFTHLESGNLRAGDSGSIEYGSTYIWQFPVGVNVGYEFTCGGGWKTRTMADISVVPAAGDRAVDTKKGREYNFPSARYADVFTYRGSLGIETSKGHHGFGILYKTAVGTHGKFDQAVTANYQFMY